MVTVPLAGVGATVALVAAVVAELDFAVDVVADFATVGVAVSVDPQAPSDRLAITTPAASSRAFGRTSFRTNDLLSFYIVSI
jgi:hypothetical protein